MKQSENQSPSLMPVFATEDVASYYSGLTVYVLRKYRESGRLTRNIHWVKIPPRLVLYCLPLLLDWQLNIDSPKTHLVKAEKFSETFPFALYFGSNFPGQNSEEV